jgi:hypothetical protein
MPMGVNTKAGRWWRFLLREELKVKPSHLEILQHALGTDKYGTLPKYHESRNYYGTDGDDLNCNELVALGYMTKHPPRSWTPDIFFTVTDEGRKAMQEASPKPPKVSRSSKRFEEYRNYSDACDCTFRQWLDIRKTDWYEEMRSGSGR